MKEPSLFCSCNSSEDLIFFKMKILNIKKCSKIEYIENEFMVTRGQGWGGGIDWEFGIDMHTLLYLK